MRLQKVARDSAAAAFVNHWESEIEIIVKNLETVQGDERDIIFISTGTDQEPWRGRRQGFVRSRAHNFFAVANRPSPREIRSFANRSLKPATKPTVQIW